MPPIAAIAPVRRAVLPCSNNALPNSFAIGSRTFPTGLSTLPTFLNPFFTPLKKRPTPCPCNLSSASPAYLSITSLARFNANSLALGKCLRPSFLACLTNWFEAPFIKFLNPCPCNLSSATPAYFSIASVARFNANSFAFGMCCFSSFLALFTRLFEALFTSFPNFPKPEPRIF